ncbi:MAG: anti-sigma factor family protein, partial [Terriglobia bacterium]
FEQSVRTAFMTHLELANLLTDYLDGVLPPENARAAESHLASCAECRSMLEDVRFSLLACHAAGEMEPSPWLVSRILRSTLGERRPSLAAQLAGFVRHVLRPRVAYSVAMAIFSLSFLLYTTRVNLREVKLHDLDPGAWVYQADSQGHLLAARAEKFYYDLPFIYEVETMFQHAQPQPGAQPEKKSQPPDGEGRDRRLSSHRELAWDIAPALNPSHSEKTERGV